MFLFQKLFKNSVMLKWLEIRFGNPKKIAEVPIRNLQLLQLLQLRKAEISVYHQSQRLLRLLRLLPPHACLLVVLLIAAHLTP
jgi:hypothetical protein